MPASKDKPEEPTNPATAAHRPDKDKPDDLDPKGRWTPSGTGLDDLTFVPGNPARAVSVLLTNPDGCGWHGYIRDGEATLS